MTSERTEFAPQLRKHRTHAEEILWRSLGGSRFGGRNSGAKSHSTVTSPISIAMPRSSSSTPGLRSGGTANSTDYDAGRSEVLERLGVRVMRFTNEEVCADLDSVLARIEIAF